MKRHGYAAVLFVFALLVASRTVGQSSLASGPADPPLAERAAEADGRRRSLPVFSEEREAAARQLCRKHLPELDAILARLKKADPKVYQEEIREIFQVSEWLSDLKSVDERRHQFELDMWRKEMQANLLIAKLARLPASERENHRDEVNGLVKDLIDIEISMLKYRVEELEKELSDAREELQRGEDQREDLIKERVEKLWSQAKRTSGGK